MSEMDWMYDSLTERFGETLGERQKVVDALLIAKAIVGSNVLGNSNHEGITSIARFILDEWGKCSDAEEPEDYETITDDLGGPVVIDISKVTEPDISLMKYGVHTFPEGSRWVNQRGTVLVFTEGEFWLEGTRLKANYADDLLPFLRIDKDN